LLVWKVLPVTFMAFTCSFYSVLTEISVAYECFGLISSLLFLGLGAGHALLKYLAYRIKGDGLSGPTEIVLVFEVLLNRSGLI
jgi:hypothetical protein